MVVSFHRSLPPDFLSFARRCILANPVCIYHVDIRTCMYVPRLHKTSQWGYICQKQRKIPSEHIHTYTKLPRIPESVSWINSHEVLCSWVTTFTSASQTAFLFHDSALFSLGLSFSLSVSFYSWLHLLLFYLFLYLTLFLPYLSSNVSFSLLLMTFRAKTVSPSSRYESATSYIITPKMIGAK